MRKVPVPTTVNRKASYLNWLKKTKGAKKRAAALTGVDPDTVNVWIREDAEFAGHERKVVAGVQQDLRAKVDVILDAETEDGLPRYPQQIMNAASKQLEEFSPPTQRHELEGHVDHSHTHGIDMSRIPDHLLERFVKTGEWTVEMDQIADGTYTPKRD